MRDVLIPVVVSVLFGVGCHASGGSGPVNVDDPDASYDGPIGKPSFWLQNTSLKVQPTTAPGPADGAIRVEGPRASVEAYQIVVRPTGGGLKNVSATATDLTSSSGDTIAAANVTLFREFFVDFGTIDRQTNIGGVIPAPEQSPTHDSRVPDPLIPFVDPYDGKAVGAPFGVAPDTNLPIWVDVRIPADAAAGIYTGAVSITSEGADAMTVPVSLEVWDLTLPDSRSVTTRFKIDWSDVNGFHKGMDTAYPNDNPKTKDFVKRYQELAHTHRLDIGEIWLPYPNGCSPPDDWQAFDDVLAPYMDGSYWDDKIPNSRLGVGIGVGDPNPECSKDEYIAVAKAWSEHLKAKGWFSQSLLAGADEPSEDLYPVIAEQSAWLQEADSDWKARIYDTTFPRTSSAPVLDPALGTYVVCLKCFDTWDLLDDPKDPGSHTFGRKEWPGLIAQGTELWFYESIAQGPPYPGFATNTLDAAEPRIMMWGAFYEGATGFLYYSMTQWEKDDPWGPNISFPKTGDGVLLYPGNHDGTYMPAGSPANIAIDGPVPSLRLKMVRAGLQDWALFKLAADNGLADVARAEIAKAYNQLGGCEWSGCNPPSWYWKTDFAILSEARRNIAQALIKAGIHS